VKAPPFHLGVRSLIVNYHYCVPDEHPLAKTAVEPFRFDMQMRGLARWRDRTGAQIIVTFDDGTSGIYEHAIPSIIAHGIPSILFCCSLPLSEQRLLNVTKVHLLQGKLGNRRFRRLFLAMADECQACDRLEDPRHLGLGPLYRYDDEETRRFKILLNVRLPYSVVTDLLDSLIEREFGDHSALARNSYLSMDQLRSIRDHGVAIGLHTHSHFMLSRLEAPEQEREIATCIDRLGGFIGDGGRLFSYPYGISGTWNEKTRRILIRHGIDYSFTLGREIYDPVRHVDRLAVPRFDVNDVFEPEGAVRKDLT